jgi:hypothetical protein
MHQNEGAIDPSLHSVTGLAAIGAAAPDTDGGLVDCRPPSTLAGIQTCAWKWGLPAARTPRAVHQKRESHRAWPVLAATSLLAGRRLQ